MEVSTITLVTAIVGAVCGIAGAALGIINTIHQLQRNKLRIKVTPQHAVHLGPFADAQINFSIEVINLSEFPVVIADVGFLLKDGCSATLATVSGLESKGRLPLRLEPRTSYSKLFRLGTDSGLDLRNVKSAYARTECGATVPGNSPALTKLIMSGFSDAQLADG